MHEADMELSDEKERRINRNYSRLVFDVISVQSAIALSRNIHIFRVVYISVYTGSLYKILTHIQAERVSCNVTSSSPRSFAQFSGISIRWSSKKSNTL